MRTVYSQEQVMKTTNIAKIVGDTSNILILYELMNFGEKSFNELKRMTGVNAVTLSKKLSGLRSYGLVDFHEDGITHKYSVTSRAEKFRPLIRDIEKLVIQKEDTWDYSVH